MLGFNNKHIFTQTYPQSWRLHSKHLTSNTDAAASLHPVVEGLLQVGHICGQDTLWSVDLRLCLKEWSERQQMPLERK